MLFTVIDNLPYLLNGGKATLVRIDGDNISIVGKEKIDADTKGGVYSLQELKVRFPNILFTEEINSDESKEEFVDNGEDVTAEILGSLSAEKIKAVATGRGYVITKKKKAEIIEEFLATQEAKKVNPSGDGQNNQ